MSFTLRKTADGSDTLYSTEMDESYHSVNGAVQESLHVFIKAGLQEVCKQKIRILEIGFGTGLNALLTWREAQKSHLDIDYVTIEAYPVSENIIQNLNYNELETGLPADAFQQMHLTAWNTPEILQESVFRLTKINADFTRFILTEKYDLIYFDAFAPEKQPEMWEEELFHKIFQTLNTNGILVTYCAKGEVRRRLQRSGFETERIPGPPGKREMLRATKRTH